MATTEERMQILNMVAEGKLRPRKAPSSWQPWNLPREKGNTLNDGRAQRARWFRVRVTDLETGRNKVNVNLPMSLVDVGTRMGARFAPELEGMDFHDIIEQIKSGAQGKIIEVEDMEDGERVEIYVE